MLCQLTPSRRRGSHYFSYSGGLSPLRSGCIRFLFIGSRVLHRVAYAALHPCGAAWRLAVSLRSFFEFGLPFPPWMAYTFSKK